jgi:hypothetical protein
MKIILIICLSLMLFGKQIPILGSFIKTFDTSAKLQANYIEPLKRWYNGLER